MNHANIQQEYIDQAASILKKGGLIAFPTETYYGLAADPFNESALRKLFAIKKRPSVKPVLVLIPNREDVFLLADYVPDIAKQLMDRFWPGPLTMVFHARRNLSAMLTGGTGTIGVRLSPNPIAQALLQTFGGPLTATSANRSGDPPAETDAQVLTVFGDDVDMVIPGGRTPGQKPSTLIGFSNNSITCIREGAVPLVDIANFLELT